MPTDPNIYRMLFHNGAIMFEGKNHDWWLHDDGTPYFNHRVESGDMILMHEFNRGLLVRVLILRATGYASANKVYPYTVLKDWRLR